MLAAPQARIFWKQSMLLTILHWKIATYAAPQAQKF
jgi:hypothetical protein